jgi:hypothetical protein
MMAKIDNLQYFPYHCLMAETAQALNPIAIGAAQGVRSVVRVIGINLWG